MPDNTLGLRLLACLCAGAGGGCMHVSATAQRAAERPAAGEADVSGVWQWSLASPDGAGNQRHEREQWHLTQQRGAVEGYYLRQVRIVAGDGRLFRCNQALTIIKETRVRLEGRVRGTQLELRETAYESKPTPCDAGARALLSYRGAVEDGALRLEWAPGQGETLRRADNASPAPDGERRAGVRTLAGTWRWEKTSLNAEGDELHESEVWRLEETAEGVVGVYERRVIHRRSDGVFACNRAGSYEELARYRVHGQHAGENVTLIETGYEVAPSPCDNGLRRRDSYLGALSPDGETLALSWGSGSQVLRRAAAADSSPSN